MLDGAFAAVLLETITMATSLVFCILAGFNSVLATMDNVAPVSKTAL